MRRERAQAIVEAVAAVPVCVACALALADAGVIVRDRIAVAQAATRAAEAHLAGADELDAARDALPESIRDGAAVTVRGERIFVTASSGARITKLAGQDVVHHSSVEVAR